MTAQRAPEAGAVPGARAPAHEPGPAPVAARWEAPDALPATVTARPGASIPGSRPEPAPVPLQRAPTPSPAAPGVADLPGGLREITFPPRDGLGPAASAPSLPGSVSPPWQAPAASIPGAGSAAGLAATMGIPDRPPTRLAERPLTLVRAAAVASAPAQRSPAASGSATPVVARIVADASSPSSSPTVQTSASTPAGSIPVGTITATPLVQRVEGAAPAAGTEDSGRSEAELDELARGLYPRIRTWIRADVIHEREAKGLSFDAF